MKGDREYKKLQPVHLSARAVPLICTKRESVQISHLVER